MKKKRSTKKKFTYSLFSFFQYLMTFLGVALVTSIGVTVFVWGNAQYDIARTIIAFRAWFAFLNIFILSLLFTLVIRLHRKVQIERPVKDILAATEKIMQGDFSARIPIKQGFHLSNEFDRISENLNTMAQELSSVETLRTDFIANVSHELKTPLSIIQNYATMLQDNSLKQEMRLEYACKITEASQRLSLLITNILRLNKLENQQIFPKKQHFNLSEQVTENLLEFETVWEQKNIELEVQIEDGIFLDSDPEFLSLVWHNLFSNAFKFTPRGGCVSISLSKNNDFIVFCVRDTGCGMSEETLKHIFEKFYQGDTSHAMRGNGLGLALVKRVLDITGGTIIATSEKGRGSEFKVTFF